MGNNILTREQAQQLIKENIIQIPDDIKSTLKNMFKGMGEEMFEAEMNASIGYDKYATSF